MVQIKEVFFNNKGLSYNTVETRVNEELEKLQNNNCEILNLTYCNDSQGNIVDVIIQYKKEKENEKSSLQK